MARFALLVNNPVVEYLLSPWSKNIAKTVYNVVYQSDQSSAVLRTWETFKPLQLVDILKLKSHEEFETLRTQIASGLESKIHLSNETKKQFTELHSNRTAIEQIVRCFISICELRDYCNGTNISYDLNAALGGGSFAKVYKGLHNNKPVAVKVSQKTDSIETQALHEIFVQQYVLIYIYDAIVLWILQMC